MAKSNTAAKPQPAPGAQSDDCPDARPKDTAENNKGGTSTQPGKETNAFDKLRASAAAAAATSIILKDCLEALRDDEHGSRLLSLHGSRC